MRKTTLLTDPVFWLATVGYLLLLATWAYLLAAPAPHYRPKPPAEVTPGTYRVRWGHYSGTATLHPNGAWSCSWSSHAYTWFGGWHWDKTTRTLTVTEQEDRGTLLVTCIQWQAVLNNDLTSDNGKGACLGGESPSWVNLKIEMVRVKPAVPEQIKALPVEAAN